MFNLAEYETVEERISKWWKAFPDGRIETTIIDATQTSFIVMALLYRTEADAKPFTTGLAHEVILLKVLILQVRLRTARHLLSVALWLTQDSQQRAKGRAAKKWKR